MLISRIFLLLRDERFIEYSNTNSINLNKYKSLRRSFHNLSNMEVTFLYCYEKSNFYLVSQSIGTVIYRRPVLRN